MIVTPTGSTKNNIKYLIIYSSSLTKLLKRQMYKELQSKWKLTNEKSQIYMATMEALFEATKCIQNSASYTALHINIFIHNTFYYIFCIRRKMIMLFRMSKTLRKNIFNEI